MFTSSGAPVSANSATSLGFRTQCRSRTLRIFALLMHPFSVPHKCRRAPLAGFTLYITTLRTNMGVLRGLPRGGYTNTIIAASHFSYPSPSYLRLHEGMYCEGSRGHAVAFTLLRQPIQTNGILHAQIGPFQPLVV